MKRLTLRPGAARLLFTSFVFVPLLAGCGGEKTVAAPEPGPAPDLMPVEQAAADLEKMYQAKLQPRDEASRPPARTPKDTPEQPATGSQPVSGAGEDLQVALPTTTGEIKKDTGFRPAPPSRQTTTSMGSADFTPERRARLAKELAEVVAAEPPTDGSDFSKGVRLVAINTLHAGAADGALRVINERLTGPQGESLSVLREVILSAPSQRDGDPRVIAGLMRSAADRLDASKSLDVPTIALCKRVESFGRFTPVTSGSILAGKPASALLYVEVENFAHRPAGESTEPGLEGEQYLVEIAQRIEVRSADGTLALSIPEKIARDVSSRRRRDFFLYQRVDLPESLSVGTYTLKAIVRDLSSGQVREVSLRFSVTADESGAAGTPPPVVINPR